MIIFCYGSVDMKKLNDWQIHAFHKQLIERNQYYSYCPLLPIDTFISWVVSPLAIDGLEYEATPRSYT